MFHDAIIRRKDIEQDGVHLGSQNFKIHKELKSSGTMKTNSMIISIPSKLCSKHNSDNSHTYPPI